MINPQPMTPEFVDPRSTVGIFSKGKNNYGGTFSPPGAGRPPNVDLSGAINRALMPQGSPGGNPIGGALKRRLDVGISKLSRSA